MISAITSTQTCPYWKKTDFTLDARNTSSLLESASERSNVDRFFLSYQRNVYLLERKFFISRIMDFVSGLYYFGVSEIKFLAVNGGDARRWDATVQF